MMSPALRRLALTAVLVSSAPLAARQAAPAQSAASAQPDMIARIFSGEFDVHRSVPPDWASDGHTFLALEPSPQGANEIVRSDAATGARQVVITAAQLIPPGGRAP